MASSSSLLSAGVSILLIHAVAVGVATAGDATAQLPRSELAAIFRVMADLLGDPTWPQLHPRPCTDTPWPGLQCELAPDDSSRLRATRLHFGPDVSTPPCRPGARLAAPAILGLPHLRTLSLFGCFVDARPVELPPALFTNASSLEQLVLKSNPGLTGRIPATLTNLKRLQVLSLSQNGFHGEIPRELGGLAALQQLDLSYNNITGEHKLLFRRAADTGGDWRHGEPIHPGPELERHRRRRAGGVGWPEDAAEGGPELQPARRRGAAGGRHSEGAGVPGPEPQRARGPAASLACRAGEAAVPAPAGQPHRHGGAGGGRVAAAAAGAGPVRVQPDGADPAGRVRGAGEPDGAVAGPEPAGRADPGEPRRAAAPGAAQPEPEPARRGDRPAG
uniref:Predicted protein n=1 Tax=Hordeum vulgare subsp. vulgare TaxID=112509 RepID=F2E977_HORVV|nr:predicted protein [Hordeum vulgare subsp. vulgare]